MLRPFAISFLVALLLLGLPSVPEVRAEAVTIGLRAEQSATVLSLNLTQGEKVKFSWTANASVVFLVQRLDPDGEPTLMHEQVGQRGEGLFIAAFGGWHRFNFTNPSEFNATVQWTIGREAGVSPLDTWIVLLLAVIGALLAAILSITFYSHMRSRGRTARTGAGKRAASSGDEAK